MPAGPAVVVIGAGIIGASVANNLAARGCRVSVLEAASGPAQGASGKSWAWLNANRKEPAEYKDLSLASMREWAKLPELAEFPGTIYLNDRRGPDTRYESHALSREQTLEMQPGISEAAAAHGSTLYPQEGFAYLPKATQAFLWQAEQRGAQVHYNAPVTRLSQGPDRRLTGVSTSAGDFPADFVVLAAGLGAPELAQSVGADVPLMHKPGTVNFVLRAPPDKKLLRKIVVTDEAFFMQRADGTILVSFYKGIHSHTDATDVPEEPLPEHFLQLASQAMKQACEILPALADIAETAEVVVGRYPYPQDAHPIIGPFKDVPNLYCTVMHSGATLGPIVGQLAAEELLTGKKLPVLAPFRPGRDFSNQSHLY